jgi:hypothetical protein
MEMDFAGALVGTGFDAEGISEEFRVAQPANSQKPRMPDKTNDDGLFMR